MDCRAANAPSDRGGSEGGTGEAWPDSPHLHQKFLTRTYAKKYESGEAQINIDGKLGTGDTLYLINEQVNGDKKTDYSSEMKEIAIYDWVFDGFIWKGDAENGYTSATAYYESPRSWLLP